MFALLDLTLIIVGVLVIVALMTQVIIPLVNGTPLFPIMGKSAYARELEEAEWTLEELAEREKLKAATEEIDRRKAQLKDEK